MPLVIPNSKDGYRQNSISDMEIRDVFGLNHYSKKEWNKKLALAFNYTAPKHYNLIDRWRMISPEFDDFMKRLEDFSPRWYKTVRGQLINRSIQRLVVYLRHPQRYDYQAEYIFASSFSILRVFLTNLMWRLNKYLPKEQQVHPYQFKIPKAKLIKLSKLFADELMDDAIKIHEKYKDD